MTTARRGARNHRSGLVVEHVLNRAARRPPEGSPMPMSVSELIEYLEEQDPDAAVFIMSQEGDTPCECEVAGVTVREAFVERDDDDDAEEPSGRKASRSTAASDVFIVQGDAIRRGTHEAWRLMR